MKAFAPLFVSTVAWTDSMRRSLAFRIVSNPPMGRWSSPSLPGTGHGYRSASSLRSSSSDADAARDYVRHGISRLDTLRRLLSLHGAPGSAGCDHGPHDLVPVDDVDLGGPLADLHPHLYPLARSAVSGNYVCALRRPSEDTPLPLVEGGVGLPGMRLLSLNSEHYMRRMAAEADDAGTATGVVDAYNDGLGRGLLTDAALDAPYVPGDVAALGYGPEKYTLLRIGPFPDLYEAMAIQHASKGDESSSLIAAEAANGKFTGFGSTFAFYSRLLATFPNREDETKDAARVCLRLPLASVALTVEELATVSRYAGLCDDADGSNSDDAQALANMNTMFEKIRTHEQEENDSESGKTAEQIALDEANYLLDKTTLGATTGGDDDTAVFCKWSAVRKELADIYDDAGNEEMARFVDPGRSS